MNPIDGSLLPFYNQFAQRSWLFDKTMVFLSTDPFITGGVAMTFFWWAWFRESKNKQRDRQIILSGLVASLLALFVARALATALPFRMRPYLNPDAHFKAPLGTAQYYVDLIHWSSFPSDHAVLYFSLATCIYLISRKAGMLAFCHVLLIVCAPLVYLGEHYPTDILAGAVLGIGVASLSAIDGLHDWLSRKPLHLLGTSPARFYTCFFVCSFLFATNFNSVRKITFYAVSAVMGSKHAQY